MVELSAEPNTLDLTGALLVAMPGMGDPRFEHAVIFICVHSAEGAMGLIINKPSVDVRMSDILDQLDVTPTPKAAEMPVYFGGPVEMGRGFVLHSLDFRSTLKTLEVPGAYGMTATLDILEAVAQDQGPEKVLMMLGYASWGPGQLENELSMNAWLTADADHALIFDLPARRKWQAALETLGVDPLGLSSEAGHA